MRASCASFLCIRGPGTAEAGHHRGRTPSATAVPRPVMLLRSKKGARWAAGDGGAGVGTASPRYYKGGKAQRGSAARPAANKQARIQRRGAEISGIAEKIGFFAL